MRYRRDVPEGALTKLQVPANGASMPEVLCCLARLESWFRIGDPDALPDAAVEGTLFETRAILGRCTAELDS